MKLILLETVPNVGTVGDVVTVKDGFGRNFLIPRGLATAADPKKVKVIEHQKRMLETKRRRELQKSEDLAKELSVLKLVFTRKTSEEHHIFGSVTPADVEAAIREKGYTVTRKQVHLDQAIRSLGEHEATIRLPGGVKTVVPILVEKEE